MAAPEGSFLVSNCGESPTKPLVSEIVSKFSERDQQWERILGTGANHRLCRVFASEEEYLEWLEDTIKGGVWGP